MEQREFEALVRQHTPLVYRLAYSVLRSAVDAEEVANSVWIKVWNAMDAFDGRAAFTTWLHRVTVNAAIDTLRRRQGANKGLELDEESSAIARASVTSPGRVRDPEEVLHQAELGEAIETAIGSLEEYHREVLSMRADGTPYADIARALGIPKGTVMSRLYHARRQLIEVLQILGHELPMGVKNLSDHDDDDRSTGEESSGAEQVYETRQPTDEVEERLDMGQGTVDINDKTVKRAVYIVLWGEGEVLSGNADRRFVDCANPGEYIRGVAQRAGYDMSRDDARALLYKMKGWVKIDRVGDRQRLTCTIDPARLDSPGIGAKPAPAADVTAINGKQPLAASKGYLYLYNECATPRDKHLRSVENAEQRLRNKFGEGRDYAAPILEMVEKEWAKLEGERLILLVAPDQVRDSAPPPPSAPPKSGPRHEHLLAIVHLIKVEAAIWSFFSEVVQEQELGGWDPSQVPDYGLDDIMKNVSGFTKSDVLESIGRFCKDDLLVIAGSNRWKLNWNPRDVMHHPMTHRRIILATASRLQQVRVVRRLVSELMDERRSVDTKTLYAAAADELGIGVDAVSLYFLGCRPDQGSVAFGVLAYAHPSDRTRVVSTLPSLGGCDFLSIEGARSLHVSPDHPDHPRYRAQLHQRFVASSGFSGEIGEEPTPALVAPPVAKLAVPAPVPEPAPVPTEALPSPSDHLNALIARHHSLTESLTRSAEEERRLREQATELRRQATEHEAHADELVHGQSGLRDELVALETEIERVRREAEIAAQEAELDAEIAALMARKAALRQPAVA